jgi:hypothetical protein
LHTDSYNRGPKSTASHAGSGGAVSGPTAARWRFGRLRWDLGTLMLRGSRGGETTSGRTRPAANESAGSR